MPEAFRFDSAMANVENEKTEPGVRKHWVSLPHEVLHSLHEYGGELFDELITGGENSLRDWWAGAKQADPDWISEHPVVIDHPDDGTRIPIGFHGDDAGMAGAEGVLVLSWGRLQASVKVR